ncbi:hypothetical protein D4764_06G0008070 [Takifugu flavidus]|uniref:Uncharacterized protein n=1 Tax=Takifugu flavidus TaxID=433684 RepID=A0A5C6N0R2_9TELE|nr:hypothetical protein D4764_06G0008070 [Takifugu flavidus]
MAIRVSSMSENVTEQLNQDLAKRRWFSIQCDNQKRSPLLRLSEAPPPQLQRRQVRGMVRQPRYVCATFHGCQIRSALLVDACAIPMCQAMGLFQNGIYQTGQENRSAVWDPPNSFNFHCPPFPSKLFPVEKLLLDHNQVFPCRILTEDRENILPDPSTIYHIPVPSLTMFPSKSDHNLVLLSPSYTPVVQQQSVTVRTVRKWSDSAMDCLQDPLETTNWSALCEPHGEDLDGLTDCVSDYNKFCTETSSQVWLPLLKVLGVEMVWLRDWPAPQGRA